MGVPRPRGRPGGDDRAGFALTGLAACLVSPVTWVHHLVWVVPALVVLTDTALRRDPGGLRDSGLLTLCAVVYVLLCSSVVWLWRDGATGPDAFVGANAYVWITLGLLVALPLRTTPPDHHVLVEEVTRRRPGTVPPHAVPEASPLKT